MALLLPFLTSGLGPDFWATVRSEVSVEFLHAPIPRKGSGSTSSPALRDNERASQLYQMAVTLSLNKGIIKVLV